MKKIVIGISLAASLSACGHFKETMNSWVGQSADSLVSSWGPPESSYPLSDGSQVLQWSRAGNMAMPGTTYTTPQTTYNSGTVSAYGSGGYATGNYSGTSTAYVQRSTPGYNIALNCTVRVTVSPDGRITAWASQGNNCR